MRAEQPAEITHVMITEVERDGLHRVVGGGEHPLGGTEFLLENKLPERDTAFLAEEPRHVTYAIVEVTRNILQLDRLVDVMMHELDDLLEF